MKVRLDVLVSTSIKRKKPWRQIVWLGKEKESLFLLDKKRVSVLYVPSGKTKKNLPKLSNLLTETVCLTPAPNGLYLVGVQSSGEIFIWQKDRDELKTIVGLASCLVDEITPKDGCQAYPSPDCSQILLVLGNRHIFLWQRKSHVDDSKNNTLLGKWSQITSSSSVQFPSHDCKEVGMHAAFTYTEVLGHCCQLSIVFNLHANLCVSSLLIRFSPDLASSSLQISAAPVSTWTCLIKPLKSLVLGWEPINLRGAYTCQYSQDGQILAIGVNQKSPTQTSVLFMSTFTEAILVSGLRGCGLKDSSSKRGRQYWISDMTWTSDNLFLAIILCNGSAGLLSRLGEPVVIFSKGSSIELGPSYFLTFSPLITVQSDKMRDTDGYDLTPSANSDFDPLHQRFSISSHPSLPILLFSDGYIVTIAQLPNELSPMIFMRDLVLESSSHLKQIAETNFIDLTLANAYNLPAGELENVNKPAYRVKHGRHKKNADYHYSFEEPSVSLNETLDSEVSFALGAHVGAVQNMSSGKILFGEQDVLQVTEDSFLNEPDSTLKTLQLSRLNLFSVWKLAASATELWSANMDKILNHAVHNIIKLFSLVLDCPQIKDLLDDTADQSVKSHAVQTASLYKVVSLYKQLLDMLQFDYQQHHLLPHVIQLSHKTLQTILASVGLCQSDPRIKTLAGCFTLLKFTEANMQHVYVSLPKIVQSICLMTSKTASTEEENKFQLRGDESLQTDIQLGKRLTATWKLLYKSVTQFIASSEETAADVRQAQTLKSAIEQHLIELDVDIPSVPSAVSINNGERLSLDGKHTLAVNAWKNELKHFQEVGSVKNASRLFHSLLYTYILRNDLIAALTFVDDLIIKANPDIACDLDPLQKTSSHNLKPSVLTAVTSTMRNQAMHDPDLMPCIRNRAIRNVVQSMARFMAAYFSNQMIFIFPPHNPAPLPAVHFDTSSTSSRIIPKYHADVTTIIRHQKLDSVWTVERSLEYLLLSGLVCEAAWFADRVGDWKAAYQLSVAHILHKQLAPSVYERSKRPLSLPEWLTPESIMKRKLERLLKDDLKLTKESSDLTQLTKILQDISLSGVMGFVEVGSWLLEQMVIKLKLLVKQLPPLVTKDFYLPAPPLYLHQPVKTELKRYSEEANEEIMHREKASSIIQLALCVMNATHLSVAAVQWYLPALNEAQAIAAQFKVNIEGPCIDLPDGLYQYTQTESESPVFPHPSDDESVLSVQSSFRDLCSLVWLLHARDRLSLALRTREKHLSLGVDVENSDQWLTESFVTLQWAVHLVTFSRFLSDEASIYKVVLSLLLDFPSTEDVANILAEYMHDLDNLHPEIQERLDRLLNTWQGIILTPEAGGKSVGEMYDEGNTPASPRGKSLSLYFHKQCMVTDRVLKKKRQCFGSYEEFVFTDIGDESRKPQLKINIGSRPFETKKSYLEFLDIFFAVGYNTAFETVSDKSDAANIPLLRVFAEEIVKREMENFARRVSSSANRRHQGLSVLSGASLALARASSQENVYSPAAKNTESPRTVRSVPGRSSGRHKINAIGEKEQKTGRHVGLFRGMSMMDPPLKKSYASVRRYESEPCLDDLDSSDEPEAQPSPTVNKGYHNMTDLASRYWQSEKKGYHGDVRDQEKPVWSLTVSFGKRYKALQQVVEWLELWGNKSHTIGIPGRDDILDIAPQMRIQIPAQFIILSLWLLEYKYGHNSSVDERRPEKLNQSKRAQRLNPSPVRSQFLDVSKRSPSRHSRPSPRNHEPESAQLSEIRASEEPLQVSVKGRRGQRVVSAEEVGRHNDQARRLSSLSPTLDQDQIINAYTQLLDDPDDSSSIDVSSLASDELDGDLKNTLNVIRRTGTKSTIKENSVLNQTMLPTDDSMNRQDPSNLQPNDSSTPVRHTFLNADPRIPSLSPSSRNHHKRNNQTASKNINQSQGTSLETEMPGQKINEDLGDGIANQLQGVIRNELRRIMEVQHRNVIAMMGALDDVSPSAAITPVLSHPTTSAIKNSQQGQSYLSYQQDIVGSPKKSKTYCHNETQTSSNQHRQSWHNNQARHDDESVVQMMSAQTHAPLLTTTQAHRRQNDRSDLIRETLVELQNLQSETVQPSFQHRQQRPSFQHSLQQSSYRDDMRTGNIFSNYLEPQPPQGNNLQLPYVPSQAWTDGSNLQPSPFHGMTRLPLLHINRTQESAEYPFQNLRNFLQKIPPPQIYAPQFAKHIPPPPLPSTQPLFSFFTPPPQPQRLPPPPYEQPLLFLQPFTSESSTSGFPLLRMLSPGTSYTNSEAAADKLRQKEKVEETRQKLIRQFHDQILLDKGNADNQAHQMLHLETSDEQETARLDKLKKSVKTEPDNSIENEFMERQEARTTSDAEEKQVVEVADASTSDTRVNHGFVLPPGMFNSYLELGDQLIGADVSETNAAFQLRIAQAMQRQTEKRIRDMVEFSAAERLRAAEGTTAVTKDAGVNPIQEVVNEYNFQRHNNLIPPDIFMGLRFGDQDSQNGVEPATPSTAPGRGRSYLNVVDIHASSVLRDIPERIERPEPLLDQDNLDAAILNSERTVQQIGELEETLRQKFAPKSSLQHIPSYDTVTVKLFDQLRASNENQMSVAVMPRSSVTQPKAAMIRRLQDMSDQMLVIDEMSQNIEREFKSSNLLLRTIQDINDSVQRSRTSSGVKPSDQKSKKELRYLDDEKEEEEEEALKRTDLPTPKSSARSPQVSSRSRSTAGSRSKEEIIETENELTRLITEVLVQEGADLQAAGFSEQMAEQLEMDARRQIQKSSKITGSKLRNKLINMKQADEHVKSRTPYEREQLKAWMTKTFHKRHEEYKRRRNELIEREPKPFKSQSTLIKVDLKRLEEQSEKRISMVSEFMNQRLIEAEHLLGSIIVDKPEIPWGSVSSAAGTKRRNQSKSPGRSGSSMSPPRLEISRRHMSPDRKKVNEATWTYKTASPSRSPHDRDMYPMSRDTSPGKSILKSSKDPRASSSDLYLDQPVLTSISEGDRTVDSSTDLIDYARRVLENDSSGRPSPVEVYDRVAGQKSEYQADIPKEKIPQTATIVQPTAAGKYLGNIVRMQRPEATHKWKEVNKQRKLQKENEKQTALQEVLTKASTAQNSNLIKDRAKDYGSKHIPGLSPRQVIPRRVKTYSERLQEMKPSKQYTAPARQDPSSGRTFSTATFQSSVPAGPPHRQQQPQNLRSKNAPAHQRPLQAKHAQRNNPNMMMRTFLKSHGPKHKPKTYAEQLQELNPHPHKKTLPTRIMQSAVTGLAPSLRSQARTRPYSDPYSEVDYEDLASVFSDWDVDENIRNIIYGGMSLSSSATFMQMNDVEMSMSGGDMHHRIAPSENQSDYFEAVMLGRAQGRPDAGDDFGIDDYHSSVDIHEIERIAELASVGSGSVLSVIDWDAVENLIKDV